MGTEYASIYDYPPFSSMVFSLLRHIIKAETVEAVLEGLSEFPLNHDCLCIDLRRCVIDVGALPKLEPQAFWHNQNNENGPWPFTVNIDDESLAKIWIMSGGPPMFVEDIAEFGVFTDASRDFYQKQGVASLYHILIQRYGKPIAVLTVMWRERQEFSVEYRAVIEFTGWILAPVLENIYVHSENQDLRRLIDELERKLDDTEAAINAMAHDLKQPISTIISSADLLRKYIDKMSNDQVIQKATYISSASMGMSDWITSILLLASVRSDIYTVYDTIDVKAVILNAITSMQPIIQLFAADIKLAPSLDNLPLAQGQYSWIEHIWTNLISNACKYGSTPPLISISAETPDSTLKFSITNNGPAIPEEKRVLIFEPFTRLHDEDRQRSGTGIGLTTVKLLVEKLHGEIGVESSVEGTTFWFSLPIAT